MAVMLQGGEIIIILIVALVVLGPQRLPEIARKLGGWSVELRRAARDLRMGLETEVAEFRDIERDLRGPVDEAKGQLKDVKRSLDETSADLSRLGWVGPDPTSGPTAADALGDLDEIEDGPKRAGEGSGE